MSERHNHIYLDGQRLQAPQPEYKYDGKLDDAGVYRASLDDMASLDCVSIGDGCDNHVDLTPKQALKLLAFLFERKDELEVLAKEQPQ